MGTTVEQLRKLSDPNTYRELGIEKKWRVMRIFDGFAECVAYQDSRDVQKVLDAVVGPENWANQPLNIQGKQYMELSINVDGEWITKADVGTESNVEKVKGESSDALKRAAVMWGIFRNLYDGETVILKAKGKTPLTAGGKELKTPAQLSAYANGQNSEMGKLMGIYNGNKSAFDAHPEAMKLLSELKNFLNQIAE